MPNPQVVDLPNDSGGGNRRHDSGAVKRPGNGRLDSLQSVIDSPNMAPNAGYASSAIASAPKPKYRDDGSLGNYEVKDPWKPAKPRPGDYGKKYSLDSAEDVDQNEVSVKKSEYGMNIVASDHIPMDRIVPDLRHPECKHWDYPEQLPTASVVIVFHNEGFSTLLRTVHSVLIRSPQRFLREVLLVDDFSNKEPLKAQLDDYIMEHFGKVRVVRNQERSGLIRSRARGAKEALGEVVVFLDAHCEVNLNWLVPLLAPIAVNNKTMTVPVIDGIDSNHFEYRPVYQNDQHFVGIWEWGMLYKEMHLDLNEHLKQHRFSEPYESPTHAGGLLAITKKFFFELGGYDEGLLVWGGENFELSFKVWQCGGRLLWVPCSRVGHIYRPFMPYSFGSLASKRKGPLVLTNYKRVVEVWFDEEYKNYFYSREPMAAFYDSGDISKQLRMKENLQCKSFDWFVKNHAKSVFKDFPRLPPNVAWGEVHSAKLKHMCLDSTGAHPPATIMMSTCHGHGGNQLFRLNAKGQLGLGERCIDGNSNGLKVHYCKLGTVDGPWSYKESTKQIIHKGRLCLTYSDNSVTLENCEADAPLTQQWTFKQIKPRL
ncbi:PREDICTED: N-acetylgalactosaminyltransferase 7-like [Rhagoletis zephyria]|uniref:N-acetylgalactosaminyltransferase 7-like n=1 Tax=Rhagoletis zephyria TaxID=28612 RepID=UPI0008118129|nr:PREDICTED: N-acetylgalactosaminyltransferase 7-like [Rhagoletis zephyria]